MNLQYIHDSVGKIECYRESPYPSLDAVLHDVETDINSRAVSCPYISDVKFDWLPPAVPADLAGDLARAHGYPFVWFAGQMTAFLMRPLPVFRTMLQKQLDAYQMQPDRVDHPPLVGMHVRRTDKVHLRGLGT